MALTTKKKKVLVILSIVFGLLIVGGATAYMIWRVNQAQNLGNEESSAAGICTVDCSDCVSGGACCSAEFTGGDCSDYAHKNPGQIVMQWCDATCKNGAGNTIKDKVKGTPVCETGDSRLRACLCPTKDQMEYVGDGWYTGVCDGCGNEVWLYENIQDVGCNQACGIAGCTDNLECIEGTCQNPQCVDDDDCLCEAARCQVTGAVTATPNPALVNQTVTITVTGTGDYTKNFASSAMNYRLLINGTDMQAMFIELNETAVTTYVIPAGTPPSIINVQVLWTDNLGNQGSLCQAETTIQVVEEVVYACNSTCTSENQLCPGTSFTCINTGGDGLRCRELTCPNDADCVCDVANICNAPGTVDAPAEVIPGAQVTLNGTVDTSNEPDGVDPESFVLVGVFQGDSDPITVTIDADFTYNASNGTWSAIFILPDIDASQVSFEVSWADGAGHTGNVCEASDSSNIGEAPACMPDLSSAVEGLGFFTPANLENITVGETVSFTGYVSEDSGPLSGFIVLIDGVDVTPDNLVVYDTATTCAMPSMTTICASIPHAQYFTFEYTFDEVGTPEIEVQWTDSERNGSVACSMNISLNVEEVPSGDAPRCVSMTISGGRVVGGTRIYYENDPITITVIGVDPDGPIDLIRVMYNIDGQAASFYTTPSNPWVSIDCVNPASVAGGYQCTTPQLTFAQMRSNLINANSALTVDQINMNGFVFSTMIFNDDPNNEVCSTNVGIRNGAGAYLRLAQRSDNYGTDLGNCDGDSCVARLDLSVPGTALFDEPIAKVGLGVILVLISLVYVAFDKNNIINKKLASLPVVNGIANSIEDIQSDLTTVRNTRREAKHKEDILNDILQSSRPNRKRR